MVTRRSLILGSVLGLLLVGLAPAGFAYDRGGFRGLEPGEFVTHELDIPVRIVLIGFEEDQVDVGDILAGLPATYTPVVRYPRFYGINGRDLGLKYTFDYRVVRKSPRFAKYFFHYLKKIGVESPRTIYQEGYNDQNLNVLEIPETVLYIDAPSVEKWLARHDRRHRSGWWHRHRKHGRCSGGEDEYTIYFINAYHPEHPNFHVYTKTDEPDPDTGYNFGEVRDSRKFRAWGGTSSRSWFFDFSAGPQWNDNSWIVDDKDTTTAYRMPPIWEYSDLGYRDPDLLDDDMSKLARYVAINLLFTSSPLYDPLVTAPGPFGKKIAHITMFEDEPDPTDNGVDWIDPSFTWEKLKAFEPYYKWKVGFQNTDPIDVGAKTSLDIFTYFNVVDGCWNAAEFFYDPFAQMFCYFDANRATYVPEYGKRDYVGPIYAFNTTYEVMNARQGLLGFADDNWVDGTQSYVFEFGTPTYRSWGYGFTATTIHEFGHHIGLSHPHDGYDPDLGNYGANGDTFFAWNGDESDTVMHYMSLSNGFGAFNRDDMYRWEAAGYLNRANIMAADILASPKSWKVKWLLRMADKHAAIAKHALNKWDYLRAVTHARWTWTILAKAAETMGVTSARLVAAQKALPNAETPKGCWIRDPLN